MWLKFIKFNYLLPKMKLFVVWLVKFRSCSVSSRTSLFSLTMSKLQVLWKFLTHNAPIARLFIFMQSRIDRTTICHYISSFEKISIKSSKKSGLLATLVKFNQASNPHLPHQQNFVKTNAQYTPHKMLQSSVNLIAC